MQPIERPPPEDHADLQPEGVEAELLAIGQRIGQLRRSAGFSQRRLARSAGVSHGYIALLERGRLASPGKFRLDAVAGALGLPSADAFLGLGLGLGLARPLRLDEEQAAAGLTTAPAVARPLHLAGSPATTVAGPSPNVLGTLDQLRPPDARLLPVFRWGSCGDPRDRESPPDPDHLEPAPLGRETLVGPNGFGVVVKGASMSARGIDDGDVVWVNPNRPIQLGKVVLALVSDINGDAGMVVKTYARTEVGECLVSETAEGRSPVVCREFKIIGPVVGMTSWRLPR